MCTFFLLRLWLRKKKKTRLVGSLTALRKWYEEAISADHLSQQIFIDLVSFCKKRRNKLSQVRPYRHFLYRFQAPIRSDDDATHKKKLPRRAPTLMVYITQRPSSVSWTCFPFAGPTLAFGGVVEMLPSPSWISSSRFLFLKFNTSLHFHNTSTFELNNLTAVFEIPNFFLMSCFGSPRVFIYKFIISSRLGRIFF